jgi:lipid-binding SYLF domain-containing protein
MTKVDRRQLLSFAALSTLAIVGFNPLSQTAAAGSLDTDVERTLRHFHSEVRGTRELVEDAAAVLVFPNVIKAGMGIGGEYGEGVLLVRGRPVDYYNTASASFGFQLGAQSRSIIIVFMTEEALAGFKRVDGWKVGVDGSITLVNVGASGSIDTSRIGNPIVGFIFDGKGLMYNLTLEGSKISRMSR